MVHRMYQNLKTLIENTPNTAYFVARNASSCGSFAATLRIAYLIEKYAFSQKMCKVFAAYQLLNSLIYASEDNCHGIITVLTKDYHLSVIDDSLLELCSFKYGPYNKSILDHCTKIDWSTIESIQIIISILFK